MNEDTIDVKNRRLIMTNQDIERTLNRMAYQVLEANPQNTLALVGIRSRGVVLAERLKKSLDSITGRDHPFGILDIGLYRDDIGLTDAVPELRSTEIHFDVEDLTILLVDDVLYTGRTVRAALNALMDLGRPKRVQLLVLVDRGHRELPIRADFVGVEIKTEINEKVQVCLYEFDNEEGVYILSPE